MASSLQAPPTSLYEAMESLVLTVGHICHADPKVGFWHEPPGGRGGRQESGLADNSLFSFVWFVSFSVIGLAGPRTSVGVGLSVGRNGTALSS